MRGKDERRSASGYSRAFRLAEPGREIDEEIAHHLAMRIAENEASGMSGDEARAEAYGRFGDMAKVRRVVRSQDHRMARRRRWTSRLDRVGRSVRNAVRSSTRNSGYSAALVAVLALGVGMSTTIFAVLEGPVLRPLPFPEEGRLVKLSHPVPGLPEGELEGTATAAYSVFRQRQRTLTDLGLFVWGLQTLRDGDAVRVEIAYSTSNLPGILGVSPVLGRSISPVEPAAPFGDEIMLGHAFWRSRFGGDSTVIGRLVDLGGDRVQIVGVLSPDESRVNTFFHPDVWRAMNAAEALSSSWHAAWAIGRLRSGVDRATARADLERLVAELPDADPETFPAEWLSRSGYGVKVQRLRPDVDGTDGALFGSALLLLFACCANVGNLVLARRESRRHETAIRGAIGADRRDLFTDDAAEAVVLAAAAFAAGLLLAMVGTGVLVQWAAPARPPRWDTIAFGAPTVLFALAVSVGSAVVVMAIGSLRRTPDSAMLRDAWRGAAVTRPAPVLHFVLGAGQVALALVVATGAGLTLRTAYSILGTEPGVRTDGVLTFEVHLPPSYQSGEAVAEFHRGLATELMALRDIEAVGAASLLPLVGVAPGVCTPMLPVGSATDESCVVAGIASPGFFETLAMRVRGQTPAWTEPGTAVITDNLARRLWPGQDPIGREFRLGDGPTHRVTGVLETLRTVIHEPPVEAVYVSVLGAPGAPPRMTYSAVVVRTSGADPMAIYPAVRRVLSRLDPSIAPGNVRTMDDIALIVTRRFTFMFSVLAVAAAVCLVLCAIGVFGVVAHIAGRRRHEIGVRIALGAGLADIRRAVAGRSYRFTAVGLGLGLIGSLAATPVFTGMLHGVRPIDGPVWIAAAALVCGTALFAAWLPANRAARLSPRDALFTD